MTFCATECAFASPPAAARASAWASAFMQRARIGSVGQSAPRRPTQPRRARPTQTLVSESLWTGEGRRIEQRAVYLSI